MTVYNAGQRRCYIGISSDVKPTYLGGTTHINSMVPHGTEFIELDTNRTFIWEGSSWMRQYKQGDVVIPSRISFAVATSVASITGYTTVHGGWLRQCLLQCGNNGNTSQARTLTVYDANSFPVYQSTAYAQTADTGETVTIGLRLTTTLDDPVALDGEYSVVLTISTETTAAVTDYATLIYEKA